MNILSIETSCDETAVSIIRATGSFPHATYAILGNALFSQIDIHREYGGVFPALAKREHAKTLVPIMVRALQEANFLEARNSALSLDESSRLHATLSRELGLAEALINFFEQYDKPAIDLIAVTSGPGLEPALWVGINFARALSEQWGTPVVPINHMEGHILSSIFIDTIIPELSFPALALLISGGHTELELMEDWSHYTRIGETRDDAVGEAFDKVGRMLGLPYPGGPEISKLATYARGKQLPLYVALPRPMIDSPDFDFSFSGLKTAVRYAVQDKNLTHDERASVAREFEDAVTAVLLRKVTKAVVQHSIRTVIVGGGVSANTHIREVLISHFRAQYPTVTVYVPPRNLSTDNSVMIALAGHRRKDEAVHGSALTHIIADGNMSLS